jgi:hypothetical protein
MTVIGVAPPGFNGIFSGNNPDVYLPLMMQRVFQPTWKALEDPQFRRPRPRRPAPTAFLSGA